MMMDILSYYLFYVTSNKPMLSMLEQNVFNIILLSFDDNKELKMLIGCANICSSVQDHRQKI